MEKIRMNNAENVSCFPLSRIFRPSKRLKVPVKGF